MPEIKSNVKKFMKEHNNLIGTRWMNEKMNEWMNEWMNEQIYEET